MIQPVQGLAQQIACSAASGYTVLDFLYPIGQVRLVNRMSSGLQVALKFYSQR